MIRSVYDFNYRQFRELKPQPRRTRKRQFYSDVVTAFDIETTNLDDVLQSVMYIWQFQFRSQTILGRSWKEFRYFYDRINAELPEQQTLVVYVFNLSFEAQFLKSVIPFDVVFAMDDRKYLKIISGKLEFRCAYLHSNMSLDRFLQAMDIRNKKIHGFDYDKIRFPWTPLTDEELQYCINDVKGLVQAIEKEMKLDGDDLATIPSTSTGYVRRDAKKTIARLKKFIKPMLPDPEVFRYLRAAFRGGNTHANRWNSNRVIEASEGYPINSWDISSSYPSVLLTEKFPAEFTEKDPDKFEMCFNQGKACLFKLWMYDVRLKDESWGCPYLSRSKCELVENGEYDNGRIIAADSLFTIVTEIDFAILAEEYLFDYSVERLFVANKRMLPRSFREWLLRMYQDKTMLKGGDEYYYGKVKNKFNSAYGMMVQNPAKAELVFRDGILIEDPDKDEEYYLRQYQAKGWLPYQWGVWCTCYARLKLEEGIRAIPPGAFLYADTDSVKFVGDYEDRFRELNQRYIHEDLSALDRKGKRHYIGIYEKDNKLPILKFKTMGAKKYCYEDAEGLHVTISGVVKQLGVKELKKIENFREGFVFRDAGGTESRYNDEPEISEYHAQGRTVPVISNVYIRDSTYTLSLTVEYARLLDLLMNTDIRKSLYVGQDSML